MAKEASYSNERMPRLMSMSLGTDNGVYLGSHCMRLVSDEPQHLTESFAGFIDASSVIDNTFGGDDTNVVSFAWGG